MVSLIAADAPRRAPTLLVGVAQERGTVIAEVRTDSSPNSIRAGFDGGARWMWKGTAIAISAGSKWLRSEVPVSVIATLSASEVRAVAFGAVIRVEGTVRKTDSGEATSFILTSVGRPSESAPPPVWFGWTGGLRSSLSSAAARTPGNGGDLLPGLSIGDVTAVSATLDAAMKSSSLSHLTAVSGANCALVTGIVFFCCAFVGLGRRSRIALSLFALIAFVVLVTPGASVVRAAVMAAVVLLALARGRPAHGLPVLALAVILLLGHDPWLSRDFGFALSVLATGGLLVLAAPLARALGRWMPRPLALMIAVPLAAQLACQPVLILLTPTLPLYGVAANLLAEPAAPAATVLGLLACIVLPLAPALGQALVWMAWVPSAWIAEVAETTSRLPAESLPWVGGPIGLLLCAGAVLAIGVVVLAKQGRGRGVVVALSGLSLVAGFGVYVGGLGGNALGRSLGIPQDWQIAACDVGQGDALLLRDDGHVAMIDVGRRPEPAEACLQQLGIARLDLLILTHFDADHAGGVAAVAGRADTVIVGQVGRPSDERTIDVLRNGGARIVQGFAGQAGMLGGLAWRIVWPQTPPGGVPAISGNPGSVTVMVEGRGMRSLFLGDLGESAQDDLLATGAVTGVDVVKVAHHGSADQSEALYHRLRAEVGLVSVGADNGYGHPTPRALDILARSGTAVERTDGQGLILVAPGTAPGRLRVWSERPPESPVRGDGAVSETNDTPPPYAGSDRGGTWRHESAARRMRARGAPSPRRSRSSPGTRSGRRRWCWCRARKSFSPNARSVRCVTVSRAKTRAWRSATSPPTTARPENC